MTEMGAGEKGSMLARSHLCMEEATDGLCVCVDGPELSDEGSGLAEQLLALAHGQPHLYLDLNGVESLSGAALNDLLRLDQALRAAGGRLSLRNLNPLAYQLFHICRLTALLDADA
jgi:anti-anti-sigma factor